MVLLMPLPSERRLIEGSGRCFDSVVVFWFPFVMLCRFPDLLAEREARDDEEKSKLRAEARARAKVEKELEEKRCASCASVLIKLRAWPSAHFKCSQFITLCQHYYLIDVCRRKEKEERSYDRLFAKKDDPKTAAGGGKGGKKKLGAGKGACFSLQHHHVASTHRQHGSLP